MAGSVEITTKNVQQPSDRKRAKLIRDIKNSVGGWLFVLPAVILMGIFTFYPIVSSFISALYSSL